MPEFVGRLRTPRLSTPPGSPQPGEMYYDNSSNKLYWWNGTAWIDSTGDSVADGAVTAPKLGQVIYGSWSANNAIGGINYFAFGSLRVNLSTAAQAYFIEKDGNTIKFVKAGVYRIQGRAVTYTTPAAIARQDAALRRNNVNAQTSMGHSTVAMPYVVHHFFLTDAFAVNDYVGITNESSGASTYAGNVLWNRLEITYLGTA